jgi:hypothetical protein
MKKTIYIIEYDDGQTEWFVDATGLSDCERMKEAYKHLAESWDMTPKEVKQSTEVLAVYAVSEDQIAEVIESRKGNI